jgi:DNA-binding transcriptional LysR family regulator
MSKISQYQAFVAVVEAGSIGLASDRLNRSSSSVSKQITHLELSLGVQLFDRSNKRMETTEQGRKFYPSCIAILSQIEEAERELTLENVDVAGELIISLSKSLIGSDLSRYLHEFAECYPLTRYHIKVTEELVSFKENKLDFAFRIGSIIDSLHLVAKKLTQVKPIFYATQNILSATENPLHSPNCSRIAWQYLL